MWFADPAEGSGECRASPACGYSCSSARYEPRPGTKFLSCRHRSLFRARLHPGALETFFKILDCSLRLRMMAGSCRELAVAHRAKLPAQRLFGDRDAELLVYPLRKIDQPPAHYTVDRRDRAALDHPHNRLALHIIELRGLTRRFAVEQTCSPPRIEPHHPVPNDLKSDATDLRRLGARRTVIDRCNSQKPSSLRAVLRFPRKTAHLPSLEVPAQPLLE